MSDTPLMTCEQLDERLSDWLERDLDAVTRGALERHAAACPRCAELIADLASLRHAAASLPELVPSRDLWPEIEARIQAPVISIETRPAARRPLRSNNWWMAAAAAGLVAVTAGVTYYASTRVAPATTTAAADRGATPAPDTAPPAIVTGPSATLATAEDASDERVSSARAARPIGSSPSEASANSEYSRDVAQLRAIVTQRRADFDSTTIAVLEKNLELIDRAIAESRAALQRDPASEFLADQLARAMTKKVAILRTAALLPARS